MLVLGRKEGQCILIGNDIRIMVVEQKNWRGETRIGIEAPRHIPIFREELVAVERGKQELRQRNRGEDDA